MAKRNWIVIVAASVAAQVAGAAPGRAKTPSPVAQTGPELGLAEFLNQVDTRNPGIKASVEDSIGAAERATEGRLLVTPSFYGGARWIWDERPPTSPVTYEEIRKQEYTLGLSENFSFGLSAKAYTTFTHTQFTKYSNPYLATMTGDLRTRMAWDQYWETIPTLELSLPLLGNGFGRTIRANRRAIEASALAQSYGSKFEADVARASAESTYWRLSFAREVLAVQKDALDRAQRLMSLRSAQARKHLADESDALQGQAAYELRTIDYNSAVDEERSASVAFNLARGIDSAEVHERLEPVVADRILALPVPNRTGLDRADVKAAEFKARAVEADHAAQKEKSMATLDAYGSYSLYGSANGLGDAHNDAYTAGRDSKVRETKVVGVRFSVPLDFGASFSATRGRAREAAAADLAYQQKVREQEASWSDSVRKFSDAKARLKLLVSLERTQDLKLRRERDRLNAGRSTTFQILNFEQDFAQAQLLRVKAEADAIAAHTQLRLFNTSSKTD